MTDRPRTRSETFARAEERGRHLTATILSGPDMRTGEIFAHRLGLTVSDLHDLEQARSPATASARSLSFDENAVTFRYKDYWQDTDH